MLKESDMTLRLEASVVAVLDEKRQFETRASYIRRALEVQIFGRPRTTPTATWEHRATVASARHKVVAGKTWIHLRVRMSRALRRALNEQTAKENATLAGYVRDALQATALRSSFLRDSQLVAVVLQVPSYVADRVDVAQATKLVIERFGGNNVDAA